MDVNKENLNQKKTFKEKKINNEKYLMELQRFFDLADNIPDEDLKKRIIYQMLKCDETITEIFEKILNSNKI